MKIGKKSLHVLKFAIALGAYSFVAVKLARQDFGDTSESFKNIAFTDSWILLIAILLMPFSWLFEALKWRFVLRKIETISLANALKSVWYGVSIGLLTPNRIGEPVGRMAMVEPENRGKAGVMAILCGMSQQLATLLFGAIGLIMLYGANNFDQLKQLSSPVIIILLVFIAIITLVLVFKIDLVAFLLSKNRFVKNLLSGESLELSISLIEILIINVLSLIRYAVFTTQFLLILIFFGYNASITIAYSAIFATYLFASAIPSFAIGEAGVRTSFALLFIGAIWENFTAIAVASLFIWVLNVALPGLIAVWAPFGSRRRKG